MEKINIKKLSEDAVIPTYATECSAGADLYACINDVLKIMPGESKFINTGIAMEIPNGYAGFIYARSGLASKKGLAPANKVAVIDSDYRGEIIVVLHNHSNEERYIEPGERIAQLVIAPFLQGEFNEVLELSNTSRGNGGFGSTGSK